MNTRGIWFVIKREDGTGRITDDLSLLLFDPGEVVFRSETLRSCRTWLDSHSIQEVVEEPVKMVDSVIKELRQAGFEDAQIARVVVARGLLQPEG